MGYYIRCQEIYEYHGLVKTWSDKTHTILEDMESKLTKLSETDQMQGEAAESIREYIRQFYLRIIPGMQALIETIESGLKVYLDEYWLNIDQSEDAVLCEDAFTEYMDEMSRQLNDYQEAQRELEVVLKSISFADITKPEEGIITIINQALTGNMRTLATDIAELEERHAADTQEAEELAERLKEFMVESCYQPTKESLSVAVDHISDRDDLEILDLLTVSVKEKVKAMQAIELHERLEDCSEEYFEWLKEAEALRTVPFVGTADNEDAKKEGTVTIGYGLTFNRKGNHWDILREVLGWSDEDIRTIIRAAYDPNDDSEYKYVITEQQACELYERAKAEYIQDVNSAIAYYNQEHNCTLQFTQNELDAIFDYAYNNGMSASYVEDKGRIVYYYFRKDLAGGVNAVAEYGTVNRRRLNQLYLFFYGYDFSDDLELLQERLGF